MTDEVSESRLGYAPRVYSRHRLAEVAALLGDPARAGMVTSLWDGRARPAGELARLAGVTPATASAHLAKLLAGGVLRVETRGRHRFFRLADERVAQAIEALAAILPPGRAPEAGTMPPLHLARLCYDHLAGRLGVSVSDALLERGLLLHDDGAYALPAKGRRFFAGFGLAVDELEHARRPLLRSCLDWTERREHLGGALGAALATQLLERDWVRRERGSRTLLVTNAGRRGLADSLGLRWD